MLVAVREPIVALPIVATDAVSDWMIDARSWEIEAKKLVEVAPVALAVNVPPATLRDELAFSEPAVDEPMIAAARVAVEVAISVPTVALPAVTDADVIDVVAVSVPDVWVPIVAFAAVRLEVEVNDPMLAEPIDAFADVMLEVAVMVPAVSEPTEAFATVMVPEIFDVEALVVLAERVVKLAVVPLVVATFAVVMLAV